MKTCYVCKKEHDDEDIRPYGIDCQDLCFPCMEADPALEAHAIAVFTGILEKAQGTIVITPTGVVTENKLLN